MARARRRGVALFLLNDPSPRKESDAIVPLRWQGADSERIERIGLERLEKLRRDSVGRLGALTAGCRSPAEFRRLVGRADLDASLLNEEGLHGGTGLDHMEFFYLVACLEEAIGKSPDSPLFRSGVDPDRAPARGSSSCCSLAAEHMLSMFLYYARTGCALEALQMPFKVDLTTASGNIGTVRGILAGTNILPTYIVLMDEVRSLPQAEAEKLVKGGISADRAHAPIEAPVDKGSNDRACRGKEHGCTPGA